jgi:hypothetical protein
MQRVDEKRNPSYREFNIPRSNPTEENLICSWPAHRKRLLTLFLPMPERHCHLIKRGVHRQQATHIYVAPSHRQVEPERAMNADTDGRSATDLARAQSGPMNT